MKRIILFLLVAVLSVSVFGCTEGGAVTTDNTPDAQAESASAENTENAEPSELKPVFDKACAYTESFIDPAGRSVFTDEEDPSYLQKTWMYDAPVNQTVSNEVSVSGKTIVIGETTCGELEKLGFQLEKPAEEALPDDVLGLTVWEDGKQLSLTLEANETEHSIPTNDLRVVYFTGTYADEVIPFDYCGLTKESTPKDVIAAFGEANDSVSVAAETYATTVTMVYSQETREGSLVIRTVLSLEFQYSADADTAFLHSVSLEKHSYEEDS